MGSINKSHNEADGGILLFNGELILLYCDSVQCEIGGKESVKGRVYLTTHRLVLIVTPYRQNMPVRSLCAPFCAITKCNVEQPVFGANYIEATVRDETDSSKSFSFKLRFSKGGAIEFAMAMNRAVAAVGRNFNPSMPPPPAYTPSPSAQYYQAPPTVYAPGYNSGIQMPYQQFPDQPPIGFIYASSAPPPYPGLGGNGSQGQYEQQQPPTGGYPGSAGSYPNQGQSGGYPQTQQQTSYPGQQPLSGYPGAQHQPQSSYPGSQQPQPGYPGAQQQQHPGYPTAQQASAQLGYPGAYQPQPGYPGAQQSQSGYPGTQQPQHPGYPSAQQSSAQPGYPGQQPPPYQGVPAQPQQQQQPPQQPSQQPSSAGYPDLSQELGGYPAAPGQQQGQGSTGTTNQQSAWPTAPSFNPNWQEDKKSS